MRRMYSEKQIDSQIKSVIESGQVDNAKPIYWHSVSIKRVSGGSLYYYFDIIMINNDPTPFTKDTFLAWLLAHPDAEIKTVQGYVVAYPSDVVSYFKLKPNTEDSILIRSINTSTGANRESIYSITNADAVLTDNGVNKLN